MKKVVLLHCYSDDNRGDAGIIDATCTLLRDVASDGVEISAVSTFHERDHRFREHHYFTRNVVDKMLPSFFPEPFIMRASGDEPGSIRKLLVFVRYFLLSIIFFAVPKMFVARLLFSKGEYDAIQAINDADVVISKGGSFLYSFKGVNGELFLIRMLMQLVFAIRLGRPVYLFAQSVGPFENPLSRKLFSWVMANISRAYLRESLCLKYISLQESENTVVCADAAFYYAERRFPKRKVSDNGLVIGITARPHKFSDSLSADSYTRALSSYIDWVVRVLGGSILLIPQVIGPSASEDDRLALQEIYGRLDEDVAKSVEYACDDLSPTELVQTYSKLTFLVGTRLHSVIFAISADVPVVNISYHGTKSQGILSRLSIGDWVVSIEDVSLDYLISRTNMAISLGQDVSGPRLALIRDLKCAAKDILG